MKLLLPALALLALLLPSVAEASTVRFEAAAFSASPAFYVAAPGEQNRVIIDLSTPSGGMTVSDPGAVIEAGENCTSIDAHTARCDPPPPPSPAPPGTHNSLNSLSVDLGDGDDTLSLSSPAYGPASTISGGSGDDHIEGGGGDDVIDGGGGRDELRGRGGDDFISDGDSTGSADADLLDGGGGGDDDTVSYEGRSAGVSVDLVSESGGETGEGDVVRNFDDALGGEGDDRLRGVDRGSTLKGNGGDDVLIGGKYFDTLDGGSGRDRLRGGARGDTLDLGPDLDA